MTILNNNTTALARVAKAGNVTAVTEASKNIFSDLRITMDYKNSFPFPVTVVFRDGMSFTVPITRPEDPECSSFVIRKTFHLNKSVTVNADSILHAAAEEASLEVEALKQAYKNSHFKIIQQNSYEFAVEYHVTRSQFKDNGYALELEEFDLVVYKDLGKNYCHRRSEQGKCALFDQDNTTTSLKVEILINDPKRRYGDRFINISGTIYELLAKDISSQEEGVYVTAPSTIIDGRLMDDRYTTKRYTFEAADKALSLFRTRDEACVVGNIEQERKRILEEAQHNRAMDKTRLEAEFIEHKRKLDTDMLNLEHKLKTSETHRESLMAELQDSLARAKAMREQDMIKYKDNYEMRSYDRKDSSEVIKWLPVILTGAAILFARLA